MSRDPLRHVKPAVRSLKAYTLATREASVKINQNENPFDLPEALKRSVLEKAMARPWSRYPEFDPTELVQALAISSGWRPDGVLVGNGSNELIEALLLVTVGAQTRVVIPEPTFTLYALLSGILGGQVIPVPLGRQFEYDVAAILEARRSSGAPLTIVCSPNNPTGGILTQVEVRRLCEDGDGLVVIDEAYHEFSGETVVPLLAEHSNLVVLRTFSKARALAGLRVGYLLAAPELVCEINKARLPYNVNFLSQLAALAALEERATLDRIVSDLIRFREELFEALRVLPGVRPFPSRANFILIELAGADPKTVFESLYRDGVLVRDVTAYPRLGRCLRVSVGTGQENTVFLHSLARALGIASPALTAHRLEQR